MKLRPLYHRKYTLVHSECAGLGGGELEGQTVLRGVNSLAPTVLKLVYVVKQRENTATREMGKLMTQILCGDATHKVRCSRGQEVYPF
jgi:hypothetical protein